MGTQQELTYSQVEVLELLRDLEDFGNDNYDSQQEKIDAFSWDSLQLKESDEELVNYIDMLKYFGYVHSDGTVTYDGLQYLLLHRQRERIKLEMNEKKEAEKITNQIIIQGDYIKEQRNAPLSHVNIDFTAELSAIRNELTSTGGEELPNIKNSMLKMIDIILGTINKVRK